MTEEEKLMQQFKRRAILQEGWVRLTRYLVGAAVTTIVLASGYEGWVAAMMVVACGVAYIIANGFYDNQLWEEPTE